MAKIFRLTLGGTYFGVNWNNVWHWTTPSNDSGQAGPLIAEFETQWFNALRGIMNPDVSILNISAVDVPDTGDYASGVFAGVIGTYGLTTTRLPSGVTTSFRLNTLGSVIRHGYKRFTGVDEAAMTSGVPNTTFQTAMGVLITKFSQNLSNGGYTFTPVVARYTGSPASISLTTPVVGGAFSGFRYQRTRQS